MRKYTSPFIEIKSFSTNLTYKSCSIEWIYHYFHLSSLARYFQAGRRKEVEGEPHHKRVLTYRLKKKVFRRLHNHTAMVSRAIQVWISLIGINFVPTISSRITEDTKPPVSSHLSATSTPPPLSLYCHLQSPAAKCPLPCGFKSHGIKFYSHGNQIPWESNLFPWESNFLEINLIFMGIKSLGNKFNYMGIESFGNQF